MQKCGRCAVCTFAAGAWPVHGSYRPRHICSYVQKAINTQVSYNTTPWYFHSSHLKSKWYNLLSNASTRNLVYTAHRISILAHRDSLSKLETTTLVCVFCCVVTSQHNTTHNYNITFKLHFGLLCCVVSLCIVLCCEFTTQHSPKMTTQYKKPISLFVLCCGFV